MDLRDKLRQMGAVAAVPPRSEPPAGDLESVIPGEVVENAGGRCYRVTRTWPLAERHGHTPLDGFRAILPHALALAGKDPQLADLDLSQALFIDTETTGLAGGAGTVPFLVGLGWVEDDTFRVEQYFMRDYPDEPAVLTAIGQRLEGRTGLVSYNGKAYDLGLLKSRHVLRRMTSPFDGLPHLDLLHAARRFWRRRLPDCSLGTVEQQVLGFTRQGDVPGFLIPQLYFDYLRDRRSAPLAPVFTHNQWDIVSLLAVAGLLGRLVSSPESTIVHGQDWLALARILESRSDWHGAAGAYDAAFKKGLSRDLTSEARWQRSLSLKRAGRWDEALAAWRECIQKGEQGFWPYEEAAKYYEHRVRDVDKARQIVNAALERLELRRELGRDGVEGEVRERLVHRLSRLERKMGSGNSRYGGSEED